MVTEGFERFFAIDTFRKRNKLQRFPCYTCLATIPHLCECLAYTTLSSKGNDDVRLEYLVLTVDYLLYYTAVSFGVEGR